MTPKIFAILLLLFAITSAQTYGAIFAYSWLAGFCLDQVQQRRQACDPNQVALWDDQSFTIHGIWPDQVTTQSFGAFNYALIQKETKLLDDMHNYWPPKSKPSHSTTFLWSHEWTVHGKDYAAILFKLKPESFPGTIQQRNAALQVAFYKDVISFYQRFNGKKLSAGTMTRAAVASKLGVAESDIIFQCSSSNIIKSIQICLNITKSGLAPKACAKASSCSGTTVTLPSWRSKGQSRVTNYPAFFLSTQ